MSHELSTRIASEAAMIVAALLASAHLALANPNSVQAPLAVAQLDTRGGPKGETMEARIRRAIAADPAAVQPRLALISLYLRSNAPNTAVAAARDALAALPDNPEIVAALGRAQQAAGDNRQALATFNKLLALQADSPLPYMYIAEVQAAVKNYDAALESLNKALAIKPDLVEAQRQIIVLQMQTGHVEQALAEARKVQKQRTNESVGYALEGDIYASRKDWKEATAAYRAGLKQIPAASDLAVKVHLALIAEGDPEAAKFAASWLKEHPKDTYFLHHLAEQAMLKKDYAAALATYRTLDQLTPNSALVLNNLAWAARGAKDPGAVEYAEKANALAPNQPTFMDTLGVLLVEKGETARGIEVLQSAARMAPDVPSIRLNLAKALIKTGQKDAAKRELDELAKLGPKFPAQAEVKELKQGL